MSWNGSRGCKSYLGRALDCTRNGLGIALRNGHREWEVGNRSALGVLYSELFAPEQARRELEKALTLAGERFLLWRVHAGLGRLHCTMGHQKAAEKEHSAARGIVKELAATIPDEALKTDFLQGAYNTLDFD